MTVYGVLRGCLLLGFLLGMGVVGVGVWLGVDAAADAWEGTEVPGTFKGYHRVVTQKVDRRSDGHQRLVDVESFYPMFTYTHPDGTQREHTGSQNQLIRHLDAGEAVSVVLPRDGGEPRLNDVLSLYTQPVIMVLIGLLFAIFWATVAKVASRILGPAPVSGHGDAAPASPLYAHAREWGQREVRLGGLGIVLGGFLLLAAGGAGAVLYLLSVRQDPALVEAIAAGDAARALALAQAGRGVEARAPNGEAALILALEAKLPQVAAAIVRQGADAKVASRRGVKATHLAAAQGAHEALRLMLGAGGRVYDVDLAIAEDLLRRGDTDTLSLIIADGLDARSLQGFARRNNTAEVLSRAQQAASEQRW